MMSRLFFLLTISTTTKHYIHAKQDGNKGLMFIMKINLFLKLVYYDVSTVQAAFIK
jgi:hypothetical protein